MNANSQTQANLPDVPALEAPKAPHSRRVAAPKAAVPLSRPSTGKKTKVAKKTASGAGAIPSRVPARSVALAFRPVGGLDERNHGVRRASVRHR